MLNRKSLPIVLVAIALGVISLSLATSGFTASETTGLVALNVQGIGLAVEANGACGGISCGSDTCVCLTATLSLAGNQGFAKGNLGLALSIDESVTGLPISDIPGSCYTAAGSGILSSSNGKQKVNLDISGLECPTIGGTDVLNGTYVVVGGSGKYSASSGGTGTINGSLIPSTTSPGNTAQVLLAGSLQPVAPIPSASPTATATKTPTGSPTPSGSPTATPSGSPTASPSHTATPTTTATPSRTATPTTTATPGRTATPTATPSGSPSATPSSSPSGSPSSTATATPTVPSTGPNPA
jgi:hypothetical protein